MYSRGPFASSGTSPPVSSLISDAFSPKSSSSVPAPLYGGSPTAERRFPGRSSGPGLPLFPSISDPLAFGSGGGGSSNMRAPPAIMIRKLPQNINNETLGSMLIFAGDLIDTEIIRSPYQEDKGFATAVARFRTHRGALEARQKLDGKPNTAKEANMIVEVHSGSMVGSFDQRRHTIEPAAAGPGASRTATSSASSSGASGSNPPPPATGRSRFNSAFQSTGKVSPPLPTSSSGGSGGGGDFPIPESSSHFQNLFSPQSPVANGGIDDRRRVTGKAMINNEVAVDDETGELLKDPIGYAQSGQQQGLGGGVRRQTNPGQQQQQPMPPVGRFGSLSLSTSNGSNGGSGSSGMNGSGINGTGGSSIGSPPPSSSNGITSPRGPASAMQQQPPPTSPSGNANGMYSHHPHHLNHLHHQHSHAHHQHQPIGYPPRPQYPPINPADQNPPCNTLYVGNLPINTAEDELKTIFSKQRGYKRLCFRTKQNGPMCFVEFEDISFATKALNELYGHPLSNSVKGGIRLSFSKNPLGVRSGQLPGVGAGGGPPPPPGALPNGLPNGLSGMYAVGGGGPHSSNLNGLSHSGSLGNSNTSQPLPLSPAAAAYGSQGGGGPGNGGSSGQPGSTGLNPTSASFSSVQGPPPGLGLGSPPGLMNSPSSPPSNGGSGGYRSAPNGVNMGMGMGMGMNGGGIAGLDGMFNASPHHPHSPFSPLNSGIGNQGYPFQQQKHSQQQHKQTGATTTTATLSGGVPPSMNASYGRDDASSPAGGVVGASQRWAVGAPTAGAAAGG